MPHIKSARKGTHCRAGKRAAGRDKADDEPVVRELMNWWELLDYSCSKRLVAIMPELVGKPEGLQDDRNVART